MTYSKHWLHLNTEYYHVLKVWRIVISRGKEASWSKNLRMEWFCGQKGWWWRLNVFVFTKYDSNQQRWTLVIFLSPDYCLLTYKKLDCQAVSSETESNTFITDKVAGTGLPVKINTCLVCGNHWLYWELFLSTQSPVLSLLIVIPQVITRLSTLTHWEPKNELARLYRVLISSWRTNGICRLSTDTFNKKFYFIPPACEEEGHKEGKIS